MAAYTTYDLSKYDDPMEGVFWGDDFEEVTKEEIVDQGRWTTHYSQVLKEKSTGLFWEATWSHGSTEYQDCDPDLTLLLVEPVEVTVTQYKPVKKEG